MYVPDNPMIEYDSEYDWANASAPLIRTRAEKVTPVYPAEDMHQVIEPVFHPFV